MATRSKRLFGPAGVSALTTAGRALLLAGQASETWLIKTFTVAHYTGGNQNWFLEFDPGGVGAPQPIQGAPLASGITVTYLNQWFVMQPGDLLYLNCPTNRSLWVCGIWGAQLEGVAD